MTINDSKSPPLGGPLMVNAGVEGDGLSSPELMRARDIAHCALRKLYMYD